MLFRRAVVCLRHRCSLLYLSSTQTVKDLRISRRRRLRRLVLVAVFVAFLAYPVSQLVFDYRRPAERKSAFDDDVTTDEGEMTPDINRTTNGTAFYVSSAPLSGTPVFTWTETDGSTVICLRFGVEAPTGNRDDDDDTTRLRRSALYGFRRCRCRPGWHGRGCSVPEVVWRSRRRHPFPVGQLKLRRRPRRVVNAMPFNVEFDMLELRLGEIGDLVDVLLIVESNYTTHGDRKSFKLSETLQQTTGCSRFNSWRTASDATNAAKFVTLDSAADRNRKSLLSRYCDKIVVVQQDFFPDRARQDGNVAERLSRDYLGTVGLHQLAGLGGSDLFVLNDADEIPTREVIEFLRWHDGYTQPITLAYSLSIFNFRWGRRSSSLGREMSLVPSVVSVNYLRDVLDEHAFDIRAAGRTNVDRAVQITAFIGVGGRPEFGPWTLGGPVEHASVTLGKDGMPAFTFLDDTAAGQGASTLAGWHCSWCFPVDGIRTKLTSAQNGDFPRWGDYPEKLKRDYIERLVECGTWFDDKTRLEWVEEPRVPRLVKDERLLYEYLLPNRRRDGNATGCMTLRS